MSTTDPSNSSGVTMDLPMQAVIDALSNQRNAALNELAKAQAMLSVALAEVERLAKFKPKDKTTGQPDAAAENPVKPLAKRGTKRR